MFQSTLNKNESDPPSVPSSRKSTIDGKKRSPMKNITINIPEIYDENIQKLISLGLIPSRSEAVRTALREFLHNEYGNLELLGFFEEEE